MSSRLLRVFVGAALLLLSKHTVQSQTDGSGSGVNCTDGAEGDVRLVNGQTQFEGRVELCFDGDWRTVYGRNEDRWTLNDTRVVCTQVLEGLGQEYNGGIAKLYQYDSVQLFGRGPPSQLVYTYNRDCNGNETDYLSCRPYIYNSGPVLDDDHRYDVGVICIPANRDLIQACESPEITSSQFQCLNGYCLKTSDSSSSSHSLIGGPREVCDEFDDCGDCSDECHCNYYAGTLNSYRCRTFRPTTVCICTDSEFQCDNGYCIDSSDYCDGVDNCGDASDELTDDCLEQKARAVGRTELGISLGVGVGGAVALVLLWLVVFGVCMMVRSCPLRKTFSEQPLVTPADSAADSDQPQSTEPTA